MDSTSRHRRVGLLAAFLLLHAGVASAAVDPVARCLAAKMKAASKKATDKSKCHQKALVKSLPVDPECLTKAEDKFAAAVTKADAAVGCPGTAANLEDRVDFCVDSFVNTLICPGKIVGGFCWIAGAAGASCDVACAAKGLAYDPATLTYAGSSGTDANCAAVMTAFGYGPYLGSTSCGSVGCNLNLGSPFAVVRCVDGITTSDASSFSRVRACACM